MPSFGRICSPIKFHVCPTFARNAKTVNTAFAKHLHTVQMWQKVQIPYNFMHIAMMRNILLTLVINLQVTINVCTTFAPGAKIVPHLYAK